MQKSYAVFGLGQFGGSLVKAFHAKGAEVLGIDKSEEKVNEYSTYATYTICANAVDEKTLKQIGIRNIDHAFVSFGDDIEASILTSLLLIEMGVPKVWTKAQNDYHQKFSIKSASIVSFILKRYGQADSQPYHVGKDDRFCRAVAKLQHRRNCGH